MKFYSELTKQLYDSEKALMKAEAELKETEEKKRTEEKIKKEARAKRAKEVDEALKAANEAQTKAISLLKDFIRDYGYFHTSFSTNDVENKMIASKASDTSADLLDTFLRF